MCAAFNTKTGEVLGKTAARHTSAEFVAFRTDLVVNQPRGKEIHRIADNLSARKTHPVPTAWIELVPQAIDFGPVVLNGLATLPAQIRNKGNAPL